MNNISKSQIIEKVKTAGVVGAGGAGFPTHIKLSSKVDTVIANGVECEPLLYTDKMYLKYFAKQVVDGLLIAMKATDAKKGIIAVKKKADVSKITTEISKLVRSGDQDIAVKVVGDFYPAGDEHILVYEMTGKAVPQGGLPLDAGVLVQNVGTLVHISNAVKNIPVTEKLVSVVGEVKNPQVINVPIGMSYYDVIKMAGGALVSDFAVIDGGPIMGNIVNPLDKVKKTTSGIVVLPQDHFLIRKKSIALLYQQKIAKSVCNQCTKCTELCPRFLLGHELEPHKVMRLLTGLESCEFAQKSASLCVLCGTCEFVACKQGLSPRAVFDLLKRQKKLSAPKRETAVNEENWRELKKIPAERLLAKLDLERYAKPLEFLDKKSAIYIENS